MSYSIPRNISGPLPPGERRLTCAYCGAKWLRSECRKDAAGYWVCPDEGDGRDQVTLDRLNAQGAAEAFAQMKRPIPPDW